MRDSTPSPEDAGQQENRVADADPWRVRGGFADLVGYELAAWEEDLAKIVLTVEARHLNRSGVMHGGVLTTLIDTACGYCGCFSAPGESPRRAFTLSLTSSFVGTAKAGQRLIATGRRSGGGKSIFFAECQVHDEASRLIGSGQGSFKYITLR